MRPLRSCAAITSLPCFDLLHHGLLAVDVLAGVQRVDGDARVPVVGRGDDHGVDVLARQHLAIVARGEEVVAADFLGARQAAVVDVADGHQFDAGEGQRVVGVAGAHAAGADEWRCECGRWRKSSARPGRP